MCITNIMLVKTNQVYNNLRAVKKKKKAIFILNDTVILFLGLFFCHW